MEMADLQYRVGFLGCPPYPGVAWSRENFQRLKDLGFNTVQLNIAWGSRPGGEALNLEDVIDVPEALRGQAEMLGDQSPARRARRLDDLRERARLAKEFGFRSIFHFGAPYVGDINIGDAPPNCLLDGRTPDRCDVLLREFARQFPEIDDILVYTYDQHAWLCSEFGPCPRCIGIPLPERLVPFLDRMKAIWLDSHPTGRMWWEPWELSAGQVQQCVCRVDPVGFGLALHCNIAEVMTALPTDRWVRNTSFLAAERGIPVIVEYFLGGPSEEVEPFLHLSHPLATLRGLQRIAQVPHVAGIKEYYGLIPDREDPNLRMAGLFFKHPDISEEDALDKLSEPYGDAASAMKEFWRLTSDSIELFPWDTSWLIREIGRSDPVHSMSAAFIRGVPWHTPSWMSTRRAIFMKVDASEPDPWMLEDVQFRCELAATRMERALALGRAWVHRIPTEELSRHLEKNLMELGEMRRRTLAYVFHARETNLVASMRECRKQGIEIPSRVLRELSELLVADQANQQQAEPVASALRLLKTDLDAFLETYFTLVPDAVSKGHFSVTSR